MKKLIIFILLCALSVFCAAFLTAWGAPSIREAYVIEKFDDPFLVVLYAPFVFAFYWIVSWWYENSRRSK
ncbi:MAG: hypothetical protein ABGW87_06145 [Sphingomonadaceae bacterium]